MLSALKNKYQSQLTILSTLLFLGTLLLAFFSYFTEAFFYQGFLTKHFLFNPTWTLLLLILAGLLHYYINHQIINKFNRLVFFTVNEALILLIIIYIFFNQLERAHYPNYVFSNFHIHPELLIELLKIALIWKAFDLLFYYEKSYLKQVLQNLPLLGTLITLFMMIITAANLLFISNPTIEYYRYFFAKPIATFEQRRSQIMKEYAFYLFMNEHTPEDAIIATPPQVGPWLVTGNAGYGRYYVYPRKMINGSREQPIPQGANYMLVSYYDWTNPDHRAFG